MPKDARPGEDPAELIRAMALSTAAAQNYLVGVQVRTLALAGRPNTTEEASRQILDGITCAIRHLQVAASIIEDSQREDSDGPLTLAALSRD